MERVVVLFVEGDTEKYFYNWCIGNMKKSEDVKVEIKNIKGVGNYCSKMFNIIKNEITPKYRNKKIDIVFCYDTDAFEYSSKPPVNWQDQEKRIKSDYPKINVFHIKAEKMIEDWFLLDLKGLGSFLGIKYIPNLQGKTGLEKMQKLFKMRHKIYQKGNYTAKFIESLDFSILYSKLPQEFETLNKLMGTRRET